MANEQKMEPKVITCTCGRQVLCEFSSNLCSCGSEHDRDGHRLESQYPQGWWTPADILNYMKAEQGVDNKIGSPAYEIAPEVLRQLQDMLAPHGVLVSPLDSLNWRDLWWGPVLTVTKGSVTFSISVGCDEIDITFKRPFHIRLPRPCGRGFSHSQGKRRIRAVAGCPTVTPEMGNEILALVKRGEEIRRGFGEQIE